MSTDLTDVVARSIAALHAVNTGRPLHCMVCRVTFLDPREGLAHLRQHEIDRHPAKPRSA